MGFIQGSLKMLRRKKQTSGRDPGKLEYFGITSKENKVGEIRKTKLQNVKKISMIGTLNTFLLKQEYRSSDDYACEVLEISVDLQIDAVVD